MSGNFRVRLLNRRSESRCCHAPQYVYRVTQGGFVKQRCSVCGKNETTVSRDEADSIRFALCCASCERELNLVMAGNNYAYQCARECAPPIDMAIIADALGSLCHETNENVLT